ncbi:hypothetical protein [Dactylosporangium sp. NPDC005555]|uniref:hypothetical protein n=1 Tax=Dactylosporangium sp. NPDC005555 TaxID=3154889 RepID=UPI0033B622A9
MGLVAAVWAQERDADAGEVAVEVVAGNAFVADENDPGGELMVVEKTGGSSRRRRRRRA